MSRSLLVFVGGLGVVWLYIDLATDRGINGFLVYPPAMFAALTWYGAWKAWRLTSDAFGRAQATLDATPGDVRAARAHLRGTQVGAVLTGAAYGAMRGLFVAAAVAAVVLVFSPPA